MAKLKLTQLSTSEFKFDSGTDFCLNSNGNCMILTGNSDTAIIFELMHCCDTMILMPYSSKKISASSLKPIAEIVRNINFVTIYETGTVQESQELALDLIYAGDCRVDPLKTKVLQADIITFNDINICCILTTYGYCEIFRKAAIIEEWKPLDTNLPNILVTEVFPINVSPSYIKTYKDLKTFTNDFIITCFVMSLHVSDLIIYLGTAAGYVVALKYDESLNKFQLYCKLKTSLNRISYIIKYSNLILVGCDQGKVLLVKINFENIELKELDYLWSKPDRMSCRKAIFTLNENLSSYLVVFCKAAHILAYRLDIEGAILCSSSFYVSGIKITGIESVSENEFIVTTIMGTIKMVKIISPAIDEIHFAEQVVEHEFDALNYQILGIAASPSKKLWSFVLFRNKEYLFRSKYTSLSVFLNVCKLSGQDSIVKLNNFNTSNLNLPQDLIMSINLDIFNNMEIDKYMEYSDLKNLEFSDEINDSFVKQLQIKLIITRKLTTYQKLKYKKLKMETKKSMDILRNALQMIHILGRLRYLKQQILKGIKFSNFQELSIVCMQLQFNHLFNDIAEINNSDEQDMQCTIVEKLMEFLKNKFAKNEVDTSKFGQLMEYCMICNQAIKGFKVCEQEHDIRRCSISCTQLPLFKTKYCPQCHALARNDDVAQLKELFAPGDPITCIYCRFLLKQYEF